MTLRDLASLEEKLKNKINLGLDIGSSDILTEFSKEIKPRNFISSIGIDLIRKSFSLKNNSLKKIRTNVLKVLNKNNFAKKVFFGIADEGIKL